MGMQLILLSLFAWTALSVPVALFVRRLCRFNEPLSANAA
ncbi:hypothetical protein BH24ACI4_BH24ACI4_24930 [soil metagenome]